MINIYLGGSFDPVHLGHLQMGKSAFEKISHHVGDSTKVDLSFLPTAGNPFKRQPTAALHRLAMLKKSIGNQGFLIDNYEIQQEPPTYTIDTVLHLKRLHPKDQLIFVIGQDSLIDLPRWKDSNQLLNLVKFWVFGRHGSSYHDLDPKIHQYLHHDLDTFLAADQAIYLDNQIIPNISSSQVRTLIHQKKYAQARRLLVPAVFDYIQENRLYQNQ